jgi:peptidyl-prolyl cis-trans isomerase D
MLNQFRSMAGGFGAKVLLSLLVLSFAVWGIGDMVRHPGSSRTVATVGGTPIYVENYQAALRHEAESIRQALGDKYSPEILKALHPETRALQSLVRQVLLKKESEKTGIIPSDADVVARIRANANFQDNKGNFDKARFESALAYNHISEKSYVERLRQELASGLMLDALSVSLPVTDIAVRTVYEAQEEQRGATIYVLGESLTGNNATPTKDELEKYFAQHARAYTAPEYRTVSYAIVHPEDMKNKAVVSEEALLSAYKDRIDDFKRPERREVDQLLFSDEKAAKKASDELAAGKNFDEVAKTSPITNKGNVSLGKVEQDKLLDAAAEEVFALPKGGVTEAVQSPFGWHIFHVRSIEPPSTAPFNEVRAQLEKEVKQESAENAQTNYLNKLEDTLAGGATLLEAAKEFGLNVQSVGPIVRSGKSPNGADVKLPDLDKFLDAAFSTEEKNESPLVRSKGGLYYVLRVDSATPKRNLTLDEVRGKVLAAWQSETRQKRLGEIADTIAKQMADAKTRNETISKYHLSPAFTGALKRSADKAGSVSIPPMLVGDIFRHAPGESTGAYALASGGYVIAVAGNHIAAGPMDKKTGETIRKSLDESMNKEVVEEYLRYLEHKYPVEINEKVMQALTTQSSD